MKKLIGAFVLAVACCGAKAQTQPHQSTTQSNVYQAFLRSPARAQWNVAKFGAYQDPIGGQIGEFASHGISGLGATLVYGASFVRALSYTDGTQAKPMVFEIQLPAGKTDIAKDGHVVVYETNGTQVGSFDYSNGTVSNSTYQAGVSPCQMDWFKFFTGALVATAEFGPVGFGLAVAWYAYDYVDHGCS